jgi:hypothetical protein
MSRILWSVRKLNLNLLCDPYVGCRINEFFFDATSEHIPAALPSYASSLDDAADRSPECAGDADAPQPIQTQCCTQPAALTPDPCSFL